MAKKIKSESEVLSRIPEIEEMVAGGVEMIVGAKKDQDFGTTVMVGLGGIYAETILKLGLIIENCPDITEIEINPLRVFEDGKGIVALDVRGVVS